jgi:hypothetical protein
MIHEIINHPLFFFALSIIILWLAALLGTFLRHRWHMPDEEREDFGLVITASLTLLGLIIGFTFSMAMTRYDQRKNDEEAEANAIGTEYVRADLLSPVAAQNVRSLLKRYIEQRLLFYGATDRNEVRRINTKTAQIQNELWAAIRAEAAEKPTPITGLVVAGMNDVLNSQGYTQAAWWNRIPTAAWSLMAAIAIFCNIFIGYWSRSAKPKIVRYLVFSVVISIAFLLIADIESPRGGLIRVVPQNLQSLYDSLPAQ